MKFLYVLLLLACSFSAGAIEYLPILIPADLQKDANAVIRNLSETFTQTDRNNGVHKVSYAITILNSKGRDAADFLLSEDSFSELKNFSGEIINASGKTIKKIAKKDLVTMAYSTHLASDDKRFFYKCQAPNYPFTVKYEYEVKYKNGILGFPPFFPIKDYNVSVEQSEYTLQLPAKEQLRYKLQNGMPEPAKSRRGNDSIFVFALNNYAALPHERNMPPYTDIFPYALLSPAQFCVEGVCGDMSTWESFGKWQQSLLVDRDRLPVATVNKIKELTAGITDKREKVKRVYEFLQQTTHYVSIQLGIGGWQPLPATEVAKNGFGDCKALSNYMKALLAYIGIPSYYTVISTTNERLFRDFPNFSQANHVILMVPMEKDNLWLECTSQTLPFGYIHETIAGHDALAVGADAAFFCTLPTYRDEDNKEINTVTIRQQENGIADFDIHSSYLLQQYEKIHYSLLGLSTKEEANFLAENLRINKPEIKDVRKIETKSERPVLELNYTVRCEDYASKTGSRLFVPCNPTRTNIGGFSATSRRFDIKFARSWSQIDTITIQIPQGYELEALPKHETIESEYGFFKSEFKQDDEKIIYIQTLDFKKGQYPPAQYNDIQNFLKKIEALQKGVVILKKK